MLTMEVEVGVRDSIRVRHVVINALACQPVGAGAILLGPADSRIDRNVGDVDPLGHQLSGHALCKPRFAPTGHRKSAA